MKPGDWITQNNISNDQTYALVIKQLINKSFQVIAHNEWHKHAFSTSIKGWYPTPYVIDRSEVPEKIIVKIERHMETLRARLTDRKTQLRERVERR